MFIWKNTKLRCNPFAQYTDANGTTYPRVPADLYEEIADPLPPEEFSASPDHYFVTEQDAAPYVIWTKKSEEQIAAIELAKIPKCSPRQLRQALTRVGLRTAVEAAVASGEQDLKDWWEFATEFERGNEHVIAMAAALEVSDKDLDDLFKLAASL